MGTGNRVRFCNNPVCERCDEHLRPRDILRKAGRDVCPRCREEVVVEEARPRPKRLSARARSEPRPA